MILFIDSETSGFPHTTKPVDYPEQPHCLELAACLTDNDGKLHAAMSVIIDPGVDRGVRISEKVVAIHGIDEEKAWRFGIAPDFALTQLLSMWERADKVVAHRAEFDLFIIRVMAARYAWIGNLFDFTKPSFCTQAAAKDVLGSGSNLSSCYKSFFGEELVGAHGAWADMEACKRVYFHLKSIGAA